MVKKQLINIEPIREQLKEKLMELYDSTTFMNTSTINLRLDLQEAVNKYTEQNHLEEPKVYITAEAYTKMRKLVDDTTTEIGWYGIVEEHEDINSYLIKDIIVYPQTVTGATCEQDDDKMFDFEMSLTDEQVNHKRFHGHSHVNMGVTPSGVDENFYLDLLSQVTDYFIITIQNKRGDATIRFYDVRNNIVYEGLDIIVINDNGSKLDDWYDNAKDMLTTKTTYTTYKKAPTNTKAKTEPVRTAPQYKQEKWPLLGDTDEEDIEYNSAYWEMLAERYGGY